MGKIDEYVSLLRSLDQVEPYLLEASGLPGPRANIELAEAAARVVDEETLQRWASLDEAAAPENTPQVLLVFAGLLGLGRLLAEGRHDVLPRLRAAASDSRWRVREGVATALQHLGDADFGRLCSEMDGWLEGTWLEQRAAAAAVCEPRFMNSTENVGRVLAILDRITTAVAAADQRAGDDFRALRQALGYCWSVAVAASPGRRAGDGTVAAKGRPGATAVVIRSRIAGTRPTTSAGSCARTCASDGSGRADPPWVARWTGELGRS